MAYRQSESRTFPGRFRSEERVEHPFLHFRRNSCAIIADLYLDMVIAAERRRADYRLKASASILRLALGHGIKAIRDQIEKDAGDFLRKHLDHTGLRVKITLQRDIELRRFRARAVISEIEALIHECIDVGTAMLAASCARMQEHVFHDGIGAPAMLDDLAEIFFQGAGQVIDF